ncbi:hypothetical protein JZU61_04440 [bacterium]|jgi:hypothetical protein|nr:hypothetical protein [bacterium]
MLFEVNGKPAVKILAKQIKALDKAILFDCEGDEVWLPKSSVQKIDDETIMVQEWIYNQKFN